MKKMFKHWKEYAPVGLAHMAGGLGLGFLLSAYFGIGGATLGWILVGVAVVIHFYIWMS